MAYSLSCGHQPNLALEAKQEEGLFHVYNGGVCLLAWFLIGYRKSTCYQQLLFTFEFKLKQTSTPQAERSAVLVISPLVSVMLTRRLTYRREETCCKHWYIYIYNCNYIGLYTPGAILVT